MEDSQYQNPLTTTFHSDQKRYVESLITSLVQVKKDLYTVEREEATLIDAILALTPEGKGSHKIKGVDRYLKVKRRTNVSYPKQKGEPHPLEVLCIQYPALREIVRVSYAESGNAIQRFLDADPNELKPGDALLAIELCRCRETKEGKPEIGVGDL